jgi:soluble lytic murein transglycosylase-like protein
MMVHPLFFALGRLQSWITTVAMTVCLMSISPLDAMSQCNGGHINLKALYEVVGRTHNIDADLLEAIAEVESGSDPMRVSRKGAIGLMQLMPSTATEFAVLDPFDPVSNVLGAADFLDYLRRRFSDHLNLQGLPDLLAAYNAGPAAVEKYGGVPPYPETHEYVRKVIDRYTNTLTRRPIAVPRLVFNPAVYDPAAATVAIGGDSDSIVLDQLTAIRHQRGRFAASIARDLVPWVNSNPTRKSASSP